MPPKTRSLPKSITLPLKTHFHFYWPPNACSCCYFVICFFFNGSTVGNLEALPSIYGSAFEPILSPHGLNIKDCLLNPSSLPSQCPEKRNLSAWELHHNPQLGLNKREDSSVPYDPGHLLMSGEVSAYCSISLQVITPVHPKLNSAT